MTPHDRALLVLAELELAHDRGEIIDGDRVAEVVIAHTADTDEDRTAVLLEVRQKLRLTEQAEPIQIQAKEESKFLLLWAWFGLALGPALVFGVSWVVDLLERML